MRSLLLTLALCPALLAQSAGDFLFQKKSSTGPLAADWVTPGAPPALFGTTTGGDAVSFVLGSGLAISGNTLSSTGSGGGTWGSITGTLSAQTDLQSALDAKASTASLAAYLTTATAASTYQPLDADLTSIAALTTTSFGRGLLTETDAASTRTTLGLGTLATQSATISDYLTTATAASTYAPIASPTFTGTVTNGRVSMTSGAVTITNLLFPTRTVAIGESGIGWGNVGGSGFSVSLNPSTPTADRIVQFNPNGAIVSTADTGIVTNAMLAGSIAISKIAATGSANNTTYLRGDGSWATPSGGGGGSGGNWVLISTTTISGSPSTLDFTFSGSYRRYRLELEDVTQSSPFSYILRMQTSTDGGSTFDSSSLNYGYSYGPLGSYGAMSTTGTYIQLLPDSIIGLSGMGVWGEIDFYDPLNASTRTFAKWNLFGCYFFSPATNYVLGSGVRDSAADVNAVRLFWSTGTFAGGKIRLFGWSE